MECQTFDSSLLDGLYVEPDSGLSSELDEHAASCETCFGRIARLRKTRTLVRPELEAPLPGGLEARILAAAEAAMDERAQLAAGDARAIDPADADAGAGAGD